MQSRIAKLTPLRAAIYCRISETDDEFDKVEMQEENCREFCGRQGYQVSKSLVYVDDGISAWREDVTRPKWEKLLRDIPSGRFDVIVATFENRLTRQVSQKVELLGLCRAHGVVWHTINNGRVDPVSKDQQLLAIIKGWQADSEIAERIVAQKQRFTAERAAGRPLWGHRPFGFEQDRITHREDEANEVRWAYEQISSGQTIYSIIKSWNERGIRTSRGNQWSYASVQQLLKRPSNAGLMEIHGAIDYSIQAAWNPIVDHDLWELVRSRVTKDPDDVRRQFEPRWLLAGIARCGVCSQPFRSSTGSDRRARYPVYRCKRSMLPAVPAELHADGTKVRHASAKAHVLDALAADAVVSAFMFAPTALLPADTDSAADLTRAQGELNSVRKEMAEVSSSIGRPGFKTGILQRRAAELAQREDRLQVDVDSIIERDANSAMLIQTRNVMVGHDKRVSIEDAAAYRGELGTRFASLPLGQRRTLVKSLLDVVVYPGRRHARFVVWHKVAISLNPDGAAPPTFVRPAELAASACKAAADLAEDV